MHSDAIQRERSLHKVEEADAASVARIVGRGLPAEVLRPLSRVHLGDEVDVALLTPSVRRALAYHRVASLVLPESRRIAAMVRLKLLAELANVHALFRPAGIETRVLKGLATAALDYPTGLVRHTGDVDLLVRPEAVGEATDMLLADGYTRLPLPVLGRLFDKGVTLLSPGGVQVDLHTRLNRYVEASPDLLFSNPNQLPDSLGFAFPVELRLVHAASHLLLTPPGLRRLSGFVDMSVILDRQTPNLGETLRLARRLNVEAVTGAALKLEAVVSGRTASFDGWQAPSFLERAAFVRHERNLAAEHTYAVAQLSGTDRMRYLVAWTPSPSFLRERGGAVHYFGKLFSR